MIFKNKWDGLWGIEYRTIKKKSITGAVFEIMNSKDQSGPFLFDKTEELPLKTSGADFYYGHMAYNGWTHRGHTMGTPFIASPGYNTDGFLGFNRRIHIFRALIQNFSRASTRLGYWIFTFYPYHTRIFSFSRNKLPT